MGHLKRAKIYRRIPPTEAWAIGRVPEVAEANSATCHRNGILFLKKGTQKFKGNLPAYNAI